MDTDYPYFPGIIGDSPALLNSLARVRNAIRTDVPVLICGETGTGKELVAQAIHDHGARRRGPFVPINAAAIPPTLVESTLFGSRRGAFTGADVNRPGVFQAANGGTLFLDEISYATPDVQVRLLRALQEKRILPVGAIAEIPVDARIIASTDQSLVELCDRGRFRTDLYYRLAVLTIDLPPLRERVGDIKALAIHLIERYRHRVGRPIVFLMEEAVEKLRGHSWPGNVRELESVLIRAIICAPSDRLTADLVKFDGSPSAVKTNFFERPYREAMELFEVAYFRALLERSGDNKSRAAEFAGLDRSKLYSHLKKLGLPKSGREP